MTNADSRQAELESGRMTLIEHLIELRTRVFRMVLAIVVGGVVCWIFYNRIFGWLIRPYCKSLPSQSEGGFLTSDSCGLIAIDPLEGFGLRMTIAAYGGIVLAVPVVLWQVWRFVAPGLYKHERRYALPFVIIGVLLFCLGGGLAYWSLPKALSFLIKIGGPNLINVYSAKFYLALVIKMIVAFGIGFEFPLVLAFLQMVGVIKPGTLSRLRRHMAVGITALVAVITPSGDPITLIVLSVPMYLFYEISIIFGRIWNKRRAQPRASATT